MRGTTRRDPTGPQRLGASEGGFALIEVMVSATLLVILAIGTLSVLESSVKSSSMNRSRGVASTLAQADQEHMRQLPLGSIAGGYHPAPATKTVGGVAYTVTSTGDWTRDASGPVTCSASSTGRSEYLTITSSVTWPAMGTTKPVVIQSIVAPGIAALGATKGAVAIKLKRADGAATAGIVATAGSVAGTTDVNGCVVLANLDAGTANVTWGANGYVDPDGVQAVTKAETIAAGATAQDNGAYDQAAYVNVSLFDDVGFTNPVKWPSVTFVQSGMKADRVMKDPSNAAVTTVPSKGLFPFTSAYGMYVGACKGNDPEAYDPQSPYPTLSVATQPGVVKPAAVKMPVFQVVAPVGSRVAVQPNAGAASMSGCNEKILAGGGATSAAGTAPIVVPATGVARIALPYGQWEACVDAGPGSTQGKASGWKPFNNTPTTDSTPAMTRIGGAGPAALAVALGTNSNSKCP